MSDPSPKIYNKLVVSVGVLAIVAIISIETATYLNWQWSFHELITQISPQLTQNNLSVPEGLMTSIILRANITLTVIQGLFTIVLASIFTYHMKRIIIDPLRAITKATQKVAEGDLNQTIQFESDDEIGLLSKDFNNMTIKLKESHDQLEQKVNERTKELNEKMKELEKLNRFMVGRETRMKELKEEIESLKQQLTTSAATNTG